MLTKKIIVLGGSGFLGTAIINGLVSNGYTNVYCGDVVKNELLESSYVYVDLLDASNINNTLSGFDLVINCVGQISNPFSQCFELNSTGIFNLIKALDRGKTRLIHISSVAVYGSGKTCSENSRLNPETTYAVAKAFAERIFMHHYNEQKLAILRLSNLYGASQKKGLVAYLLRSYRTDRNLSFNNSGDLVRYYLHIDDCIKMIVEVVKNDLLAGIYNVIGNEKYSIHELISSMEEMFNMEYQVEFDRKPAWENIDELSDAKLKAVIGFQPSWQLFDFIKSELERNGKTE